MKKTFSTIKAILLFLLIFVLSLSAYSTKWALNTFAFLNFDEIIFQLTSPIEGTSKEILLSFMSNSLLLSIICSIVLFFIVHLLLRYFSCDRFNIDVEIFKKKYDFSIRGKSLKIIFGIFIFIISIIIPFICLDKIKFIDYVISQFNDSSFIEDNYVDPRSVNIEFPLNKKNLIYIYAESLESTFFSEDLGGGDSNNYLEPLVSLTRNNINFSDTDKFGGALSINGTTWTSGALVAHTSGLPLKINGLLFNEGKFKSMLGNAYTLTNLLHDEGYNQMFMIGSDKDFGNRGIYFEGHGDVEVYDYYSAINNGKIDDDYFVWWGVEDSKLFEYAREEITNLSLKDEPFNFSLLTVNTHTVDGYLEDDCDGNFSSNYGNAIYCSSKQIVEFIEWIMDQDFYEDTTIVLVGDHVSMQEGFYSIDTQRRIYNLFINSSVDDGDFSNRLFSTMDLFPTTLASMGVKIDGERLGLGTNLFSDRKTLIEENGYDFFDKEIEKYSSFYMKQFVHGK